MSQNKPLRIRDNRESGYYRLDTAFIKGGWARKLGPYALAVYNVLACFADNNTQTAYPSYDTIAELAGCSRRTVGKMLGRLEHYNLLTRDRRFNAEGQASNLFTLLHPDEWLWPDGVSKPPEEAVTAITKAVRAPDALAEPVGASGALTERAPGAYELTPDSLSNPSLKEGPAEAAPAPPAQSSKSQSKSKSRRPKHPAVERYRQVTGRYPRRAAEPLILECAIETEADLALWEKIIRAYVGCGWNAMNVTGMCDFYRRREIPNTRPNKSLNGGHYYDKKNRNRFKSFYRAGTEADFE